MKELIIALVLARGADATTTCVALASGASERNFVLPNSCLGTIAVQAGTATLESWLLNRLHREHPKLARGLALVQVGVSSGVAGWNTRVVVELRRRRRG